MQPWMGENALALGAQALQAEQTGRWRQRQEELRSVWDTLQPLQRAAATRRLYILASHVVPSQLSEASQRSTPHQPPAQAGSVDVSPFADGQPSNFLVNACRSTGACLQRHHARA